MLNLRFGQGPRKLSRPCLAALFSTLEVQVGAGIDLQVVVHRFLTRLQKRGRFKRDWPALLAIASSLQGGHSAADALRPHLTASQYLMLATGERSGKLVDACRDVLSLEDRIRRIRVSIRSAFTAPAVYLSVLFATLYIIAHQVVPALAGSLPVSKWQGTAALIYQSTRLVSPTALVVQLVGVACLFILARWLLPHWTGPGRLWAERYIPGMGLYRDLQGAIWLGAFAGLLKVGVPDTHILEMHANQGTPWLAERLVRVRTLMRNGFSLADALLYAGTGRLDLSRPDVGDKFEFPSPSVIDDIAGFAGFAGFEARLLAMRDHWLDDMEVRVQRTARKISVAAQTGIYLYFGIFTAGVNQLGAQMSHAFH